MGLLTWSNESSVGIQTIDNEHRELMDAINELCDAVSHGHEREHTGLLLHRLIECARDHFTSEEAMLSATNYPELAEHSRQHQSLLKEVEELAGRFVQDGLVFSERSLTFLYYWFNDHLVNDDRLYTAWLKKHGVR
jgi:hemerythrin